MRRNLSILTASIIMILMLPTNFYASPSRERHHTPPDKPNMAQLVTRGYKELKKNQYDEALQLYKKAASLLPANPSQEEEISYVKALNNIGYIYLFIHNDPEQAFPYLLRAKKIASQRGFNDLLGAIYDNIAKIHDDFGDAEKALATYALALRHAVADSTDVSAVIQLMVFNDMVSCAMAHNLTDSISESVRIFETLPTYNIPMGVYSKQICTGLRQMIDKSLVESTATLQNALPLIDSDVDRQRYIIDHQLMMATLYHAREMKDSAMWFLSEAYKTATEHKLIDKLPRITRGIGTVLAANGNTRQANEWFLRAHVTDDSLHTAKAYARISSLEPILDIDILTKEMNLAESRHRNRLAVIWIMAIAFTAISTLLLLLAHRNRKLRNSYGELASRHRESMRQTEATANLRHDYEETIINLRRENALLKESSSENLPSEMRAVLPECSQSPINNNSISKSSLPISNDERLRIVGAVNDVMERSEEVFNPEFSLDRLSELTATKQRYLSAVINESIGKSFTQMLAETRVKKACEMLMSPDFKKTMTVESVSLDVGYKSRTQFTTIFKRITGLTPTQYIAASK